MQDCDHEQHAEVIRCKVSGGYGLDDMPHRHARVEQDRMDRYRGLERQAAPEGDDCYDPHRYVTYADIELERAGLPTDLRRREIREEYMEETAPDAF